jgi:hypothetical protein
VRKLQTALHIRWRWVLIGLVILASALLLAAAACGGDSNGTEEASTTSSATPAEGTPAVSQIDAELSQKLKDLSGEWAKTSVKVTYDIVTITNTETTKTRLVLYWAPPKVRADLSDDASGATQASVISTPDKTYECTQEGKEQCLAYPPSKNAADVVPFLSDFDPGGVEATLSASAASLKIESSNEKIGDQDASCVSADGSLKGQEGHGKWCFASNGLLLFESTSDPVGAFVLQATDVSEVSDSDFNPPYPVTEVTPSPTATPTAAPGG